MRIDKSFGILNLMPPTARTSYRCLTTETFRPHDIPIELCTKINRRTESVTISKSITGRFMCTDKDTHVSKPKISRLSYWFFKLSGTQD
jgi:hypothetical protein